MSRWRIHSEIGFAVSSSGLPFRSCSETGGTRKVGLVFSLPRGFLIPPPARKHAPAVGYDQAVPLEDDLQILHGALMAIEQELVMFTVSLQPFERESIADAVKLVHLQQERIARAGDFRIIYEKQGIHD